MRRNLVIVTVLAALLLAACVPMVEEQRRPVVAVINAPGETRVLGLAEELQAAIGEVRACCDFSFRDTSAIRFQETHRNIFGSQAVPQAAALARNLGSELAILTHPPRFERTEREVDGGVELHGVVSARAVVVDADSEQAQGSVESSVFRDRRFVPEGEEITRPEDDPMMRGLLREAARDLAPELTALLNELAPQYR